MYVCVSLLCDVLFVHWISHEIASAFNALSRTHARIRCCTSSQPKMLGQKFYLERKIYMKSFDVFMFAFRNIWSEMNAYKECIKCVRVCVFILSIQHETIPFHQRASSLKQLNNGITNKTSPASITTNKNNNSNNKSCKSSLLPFKTHTKLTPFRIAVRLQGIG